MGFLFLSSTEQRLELFVFSKHNEFLLTSVLGHSSTFSFLQLFIWFFFVMYFQVPCAPIHESSTIVTFYLLCVFITSRGSWSPGRVDIVVLSSIQFTLLS